MNDEDPSQEKVSKSQRKRDMQAMRVMATKLTAIPAEQLARIDPEIAEAVNAANNIHRGSARKRQIQYIAKLLSRTDTSEIQGILDALDASSAAHVARFHQLETWRQRLIDGDANAMDEIFSQFPNTDRQQFRHLVRQAMAEKASGDQVKYFRQLFQFLKQLDAEQQAD